ncbi:ras-related protein rab-5c [Anaeramoeba ignava]|uniref:Ras-related protein rab-5c n=1 Tax=Anaeramoeba ignava TaxID=1746090 RepID=A0A9Q0LHH4_ANAIG|nr:ras-related protein rab-5c [Anaeramoeba ignava]
MQIWDTAGQERFNSFAPNYIRNAACAIVIYDISNQNSFEKARSWVYFLLQQPSSFVIVLAGNKADLEKRKIEYSEAKEFADENRLIFFETSAKTGQNIREMFKEIARSLFVIHSNSEKKEEKAENLIQKIEEDEKKPVNKSGCC